MIDIIRGFLVPHQSCRLGVLLGGCALVGATTIGSVLRVLAFVMASSLLTGKRGADS
jgi:hypothetical protein